MAGVVAALEVEARTLGPLRRHNGLMSVGDGTLVAVSGMGCIAAVAAAQALVDAGATALVSWGLAGGLDPDLTSGTICLPARVVSREGATFATDVHWRTILTEAITGGRTVAAGKLLTSAGAIEDVAGKAAAFRETGAVAVDMESMGVAQVAARNELPFIAVRVIVDTAGEAIPGAVSVAIGAGRVRLDQLMLGLLRSPAQIAPVIGLARRYRTAARILAGVARTGALASVEFA